MAIKKGGALADRGPAAPTTETLPDGTVLDVVEVPEIPADIPRHGSWGTPKIRIGTTAKFRYYKRASSYGKVLEDTYGLELWKQRAVAFGMTRLPSLLARGQALDAFEAKGEGQEQRHKQLRDEWNDIADQAMDGARTKDRAIRGTALHTLSERADAGEDLSYLDPLTAAVLTQWRRIMAFFTIHGTEQFVVNDEFEVAGSYDRLVSPRIVLTAPDGTVITPDDRLILDLKTGATSRYWDAAYCVQQKVYASGRPYVHLDDKAAAEGDDGRRDWPDGVRPHQGWALIPHVPIENPGDAGLMWVNLARGTELLDLAAKVKAAQKHKDLFAEATLPAGDWLPAEYGADGWINPDPAAAAPAAALPLDTNPDPTEGLVETLFDLIEHAAEVEAFGPLYDNNADVWTPELTAAVKARIAILTAEKVPA